MIGRWRKMVTTTKTEFETQGAIWWRKPCHITDDILLSGDLSHHQTKALNQLDEWRSEGVTHILDCRSEWSDEELVRSVDDSIEYLNLGTHDAGGNQDVWSATRYNANSVDLNRNYPDPEDGPHPDGNPYQAETIIFLGLADDDFIAKFFTFNTMSVTSSLTPLIEENS